MKKWLAASYPAIIRAQGVILVPYDIELVQAPAGGEGEMCEQYCYSVARCRDVGQEITQDRAAFVAANTEHFIDGAPVVASDEPAATDDWVRLRHGAGESVVPAGSGGQSLAVIKSGPRDECL